MTTFWNRGVDTDRRIAVEGKMQKRIADLGVGDVVKLKEPDGSARIRNKERSRLFQASGGCFRLDMTVVSGPHKGERINDQHHAGDDEVEIA